MQHVFFSRMRNFHAFNFCVFSIFIVFVAFSPACAIFACRSDQVRSLPRARFSCVKLCACVFLLFFFHFMRDVVVRRNPFSHPTWRRCVLFLRLPPFTLKNATAPDVGHEYCWHHSQDP
ncbi:hypothetical protein F5148DRAFT_1196288 [Russula earlei]|uniref:Uncharacterized protein n=1 Tax=Russula earlei TaxID=71964 RepID=A0ACC0UAU1_9AGAM|nr:hypothetical protein F5148DRAFT_1196288 [Russula earlei]